MQALPYGTPTADYVVDIAQADPYYFDLTSLPTSLTDDRGTIFNFVNGWVKSDKFENYINAYMSDKVSLSTSHNVDVDGVNVDVTYIHSGQQYTVDLRIEPGTDYAESQSTGGGDITDAVITSGTSDMYNYIIN
jgi:hypothetical protein